MPRSGSTQRPTTNPLPGLRIATRIGMVLVILALGWYRGFSETAMFNLGLILIWAATLPLLTRAIAKGLDGFGLEDSTRKIVVAILAVLMLVVFALVARTIVRS